MRRKKQQRKVSWTGCNPHSPHPFWEKGIESKLCPEKMPGDVFSNLFLFLTILLCLIGNLVSFSKPSPFCVPGKWSPNPYLDLQAFFILFSSPVLLRSGLLHTWQPSKLFLPPLPTLPCSPAKTAPVYVLCPTHGLQFFKDCSSVGLSHGVQFIKNRVLQAWIPHSSVSVVLWALG